VQTVNINRESCQVTQTARRLLATIALLTLAACGAPQEATEPTQAVPPEYQAVQDGEYFIPAVDPIDLTLGRARAEVDYAGDEAPGSVVVDTFARRLYYVQEGGRAMSYAIAVGREGISFRGSGVVGRKEEWPGWQPTANMVRTRPDLYAEYAGGLPGGLDNPLGARAMYLYRGGRDSYFRIHGTIQNATIGHATSAGCIRLFNQDAIDLYNRVEPGAQVKVRSLEESIAIEGPHMDDAYGRAVPETPENIARLEPDAALIVEAEARRVEDEAVAAEQAAKDFAKAEKKRLGACRRQGVSEEDCPPAPEPDPQV
jgi:lipoprotein-anchoring transpeptidase ErfK/SrfK